MRITAEQRFWAKVDKNRPNGCWIWTGTLTGSGYGQFWDGKRLVQAHRYAYELAYGPIPEGKQLDHLCRNRPCCNPAHLEPVTQRENILRGRGVTAINARKTRCIHGHELTPDNIYLVPGGRRCKICAGQRDARYRAQKGLVNRILSGVQLRLGL